jgi:mannan endo-1,4-beta-mannosidase
MRPRPEPSAPLGGHLAPWISKHVKVVTGTVVIISAAVIVCAVTVVALAKLSGPSDPSPSSAGTGPIPYLGVYEPDAPNSYSEVEQFAHAVGRWPNLVSYYSGWEEKFQTAFAETAESHGATTIVQIDPTNISLSDIAAGTYDSYLISFADSVAAFGHEVIISFGHEMNGYWYSWGYHHTAPSTFVKAWRHIVTLFRQQGADNVKWLWQVNSLSAKTGPPRDWWPGAGYVTWVGISGYYFVSTDTFYNLFDPVVYDVRQFTQDPVLIAETGVGPQAGQTRGIYDLFAGLRMQHDIGLVWFDRHSYGGTYKGEDWRLEDNPPALAAFRRALKG